MVETLPELFLNTVASYPKDDYMMYKKGGSYRSISTAEFAKRVRQFSLGLAALGHQPGDRLIILAESSPWWVMTDLANVCAGGITVPIHAVLTPEQVKYIINDSEAGIVVFSSLEIWKKIEAVKSALPHVRNFVSFDEAPPEGVHSFESVRDDRDPQGSDADPRQLRQQHHQRYDGHQDFRQGNRVLFPSAVAYPGEDRHARLPLQRVHDRLRRKHGHPARESS
jgi:long-subunit acyl-CoA synthetase (AMP-forming)